MAFPTINVCIICELARPEPLGKFSILGYYGIAPYVRIQVQKFAAPLALCFVFAGGSGQGHFRIDLRITAPNGATFDAPGTEGDLAGQVAVSNIFMGFQGLLPGPGNYLASLLVDGNTVFEAPFGLDQMPGPQMPSPPPRGGMTPPPERPN
jgi:hypothetical protein